MKVNFQYLIVIGLTFVVLSQRNNAFDIGSAREDSDGFLGGCNDCKRLRSSSESQGLGLTRKLKGNAMEGGMKRSWGGIGQWREKGMGQWGREDDGLG